MADQDKDQKTEEATSRRLEEAREKGQVAMSQELISALMLCTSLAVLVFSGQRMAMSAGGALQETMGLLNSAVFEWTVSDAAQLIEQVLSPPMYVVLLVFLPVLAVGAAVAYGQAGFRITTKAIAVDPGKINPAKGLKKIFSMRGVMRTTLAALKIIVIATVLISSVVNDFPRIVRLGNAELGPLLAGLGQVALRASAFALIAVVALALVDFFYQRFQHSEDLRMTKQEVKDENKSSEGDPHVKARIRQAQREMASRRMMEDVPDATVVVTNPTHYAVALRYDRDVKGDPVSNAPRVVAKGLDAVALRIREIAKENGVICYEDRPLARALYAQVEVGDEIPDELYAAVATVLTYVFRLEAAQKR